MLFYLYVPQFSSYLGSLKNRTALTVTMYVSAFLWKKDFIAFCTFTFFFMLASICVEFSHRLCVMEVPLHLYSKAMTFP